MEKMIDIHRPDWVIDFAPATQGAESHSPVLKFGIGRPWEEIEKNFSITVCKHSRTRYHFEIWKDGESVFKSKKYIDLSSFIVTEERHLKNPEHRKSNIKFMYIGILSIISDVVLDTIKDFICNYSEIDGITHDTYGIIVDTFYHNDFIIIGDKIIKMTNYAYLRFQDDFTNEPSFNVLASKYIVKWFDFDIDRILEEMHKK